MSEPVDRDRAYGSRLSLEEFERRLTTLYGESKPDDQAGVLRFRERAELDLIIDHKLGVDFPSDRREAMWRAQERVRDRRYRWLFWHMAHRVLPGGLSTRADPRRLLEREYGAVLNPDDLNAFLDDGSTTERRPSGGATRT